MANERVWGGSLHQTFRLFPTASANLLAFITSEGATPDHVLQRLPYEAARSRAPGARPDPRRYRDGRHVYQSVGLIFEADNRLRVTELGKATSRWANHLSEANSVVLGRHAAYALTACQLRNPSRPGLAYADDVEVFPFTFIWRAMLALDNRISSAELNRAIFHVTNHEELMGAIDRIRRCRDGGLSDDELGPETMMGEARNDRIIPWMALASFGWLLIADKREAGGNWYVIRPRAVQLLYEAAQMKRIHRNYSSMQEYVGHISATGCLPKDVR
jgi:hypothetical protein